MNHNDMLSVRLEFKKIRPYAAIYEERISLSVRWKNKQIGCSYAATYVYENVVGCVNK